MIIRSQNKKRIANIGTCNSIDIIDSCNHTKHITVDGMIIGTYSTEEKAIKVLDMICEKYKEPIVRANYTNEESLIYSNSVFQMPSNEDVEV